MQLAVNIVCVCGILGLFLLSRDSDAKTSKALWIPVVWLWIAGSRNVGEWIEILSAGSTVGAGEAYLEGNPVDRNVLGLLIVLGLIVLFMRQRQVVALVRNNAPIFLFLLYCAVSILWSDYPEVAFRRLNRAFGDFVMIMLVLTESDILAALKRLLNRVAFLLLPLSILLIRYYSELGRSYAGDGTPMWGGVTGGKNSLGMISMLFGLGALWQLLQAFRNRATENRKRVLLVHTTILVMAAYLLREAHSATSLACFALAGGVMMVVNSPRIGQRPLLVHVLVASVIAMSVFALFFDSGGNLVETLGRNATLTGRTDVWKRALKFVENPVFGSGFESFWLGARLARMKRLDEALNQAHNGYLEIYLNLGWAGLLLLGLMVLHGYRGIVTGLRRGVALNSLFLAYFLVALIYNCTESGFKMMSPIWILLVLSIGAARVTVFMKSAQPELARQSGATDTALRPGVVGTGSGMTPVFSRNVLAPGGRKS